jgi:hypothetical protein
LSTSAVAVCCSRASRNSRLASSSCSRRSTSAERRRRVLGGDELSGLRPSTLGALLLVMTRRLISHPEDRESYILLAQRSILVGAATASPLQNEALLDVPDGSKLRFRVLPHEPVSDIDTVVVDSLKALDPERPIREADIGGPDSPPCNDLCSCRTSGSQDGASSLSPSAKRQRSPVCGRGPLIGGGRPFCPAAEPAC